MIEAPYPQSLLVVKYYEPRDSDLCVTLVEALVASEAVDTLVGRAYPVAPTDRSRIFRVTWPNYVAFYVRNESYAVAEGEPRGGGLGREPRSSFRKYVAGTTWATDDYPGRLTHWFLNTEHHCFDVIAVDEPEVVEVSGTEAAAILASCRDAGDEPSVYQRA